MDLTDRSNAFEQSYSKFTMHKRVDPRMSVQGQPPPLKKSSFFGKSQDEICSQLMKTSGFFDISSTHLKDSNLENSNAFDKTQIKANVPLKTISSFKPHKFALSQQFPKLRPINNKSTQNLDESESEVSSVARLYKDIFKPNMGSVMRDLSEQISPNKDAHNHNVFITSTKEEKMHSLNGLVSPQKKESLDHNRRFTTMDAKSTTMLMEKYLNKAKKNKDDERRMTSIKIKSALQNLYDEIMFKGSHAIRKRFNKFVETGDSSHLFFCEQCPHCRKLHNDFYCVRQKMSEIPSAARDFYFLDTININRFIATSDVFFILSYLIKSNFKNL